MPLERNKITAAIPTYGRNEVLVDTISVLLEQDPGPHEILIIDQTPEHDAATQEILSQWHEKGAIRWLRLEHPSITRAMNIALEASASPIVLFFDDDIVPAPGVVGAHADSYADEEIWAVSGQVLQPGETPQPVPYHGRQQGLRAYVDFPFYSSLSCQIKNVMAGNLSVRRDKALELGGFDENFIGAAYRFETEFARRIVSNGGRILFQPKACIRHLRAASGGTRMRGSHMASASPIHGVGDYYFALRQGLSFGTLSYILLRPFREVRTKFHLKHPWWIPVKFFGELRAILLAVRLYLKGAKLVKTRDKEKETQDERLETEGDL